MTPSRHPVLIRHRRCIAPLAVCLLAITLSWAPVTAAAAAASLDLSGGWSLEDNLSRSIDADDQESAQVLHLAASRRSAPQPWAQGTLRSSIRGALTAIPGFDDLDRIEAGFEVQGRWRTGDAYGAPWIGFDLGLDGRAHRDSKSRDAVAVQAAGLAGARVTDRLRWLAGIVHRRQQSRHGRVHDRRGLRLFLRPELQLPGGPVLWLRAEAERGDLVANASPGPGLVSASQARRPDAVFGRGRISYRLDATRLGAAIGIIWPLTGDASLELSGARSWIDADEGLDYRTGQITLTAVMRVQRIRVLRDDEPPLDRRDS